VAVADRVARAAPRPPPRSYPRRPPRSRRRPASPPPKVRRGRRKGAG